MIVNVAPTVNGWYYAEASLPGCEGVITLALSSHRNGVHYRIPNGVWAAVGAGLRIGFNPSRLPHPDCVPAPAPYVVDSNTGLVSPRHAE